MGECFITRRGGNSSAIVKLVAIPSLDVLPTTATDGSIYLVTEIPLSGTTYFQSTEPSGDFSIGDVWVATYEEARVTANIVKKGNVIVGIKKAFVWNGSEWASTEINIWTGDGWAEFEYYLIENGVASVSLSAGTQKSGYIYWTFSAGTSGYIRTSELINLTPYSTLFIRAFNANSARNANLSVWNEAGTRTGGALVKEDQAGVVSFDVSSLTGGYYVGVYGVRNTDGNAYTASKVDIYDLWLE